MADQNKSSGVNIGGIKAGGELRIGDITSGDINTVENISGAAVAIGGDAQSGVENQSDKPGLVEMLAEWQANLEAKIDAQAQLVAEDRVNLKEQIDKIKDQILKLETQKNEDEEIDPGRLERLINTLGAISGNILEVTATTLANPLAGLGLVVKKKERLQQQKSELERHWNVASEKIDRMWQHALLETRSEEKLRLEALISEAEADRAKIGQELDDVEQRLAAAAHIHNLPAAPTAAMTEPALPTDIDDRVKLERYAEGT